MLEAEFAMWDRPPNAVFVKARAGPRGECGCFSSSGGWSYPGVHLASQEVLGVSKPL